MGSEEDRPSSRPPRLEDLALLCRSLNEVGARYVVIGGFAMILHGYTRGTMDIDLLVDPSPENVRKLKRALAKLPDNAAADVSETDVKDFNVVRVADEFVVDLMGSACGVDVEKALAHAVHREVDGVRVPYLDAVTLVETKDTVRPKDKQDVLFLKSRLDAGRRTPGDES